MAEPVGDAYVRLRPTADGFAAAANRLLGGLSFGTIVKGAAGATVGIAGVQGAITALTSTFKGVVTAGAAFETQLNVLDAVTGATEAQMARASATAKELGRDITLPGVSAADAAQSMLELAKGGLTVEQSMDAARGALQLAKAANVDFGTAAAVTARNLAAFELAGDQATRVADLLAGASIAATGEVTDMAISLQQSAAVAHSAGISIDDTVTAIAALAKAGLVGSDAGTSLRTTILRLLPATNRAAAEMERLGVKILDQQGALLPLPRILDEYKRALEPLSQAQRQQALNTIFGQDAIRAITILARGGSKEFEKLARVVTKTGQANILTTAQTKGLAGSFQALQSNLETIGIQIAQRVNPVVKQIVDGLNDGLNWVQANWPRFEDAILPVIDRVVAAVRTQWPLIRATVTQVMETVTVAVRHAVFVVQALWNRFGDTFVENTRLIFRTMLKTIQSALVIVQDVIEVFSGILHGDWSKAWDALGSLASESLRATWRIVKAQLTIFKNVGVELVKLIADGVESGGKFLVDKVLALVQQVLEIFAKIPTSFGISAFGKSVKVGIDNPARAAIESLQRLRDALTVGDRNRAIADAFADNTAAALDAKNRDLVTAFQDPVEDAVTKVVVSLPRQTRTQAVDAGKKIGANLADGLDLGISDAELNRIDAIKERLAEAVEETTAKVRDAVLQSQRNLASLGSTLASQLQTIIDNGPLGRAIQQLQDQISGRQARAQSRDLQKAIRDAQAELAKAQAAVAPAARLTAAQQADVADFLAPRREAVRDAERAFRDFVDQTTLGGLQAEQARQRDAIQKRVNDLVTAFNNGLSEAKFSAGVATILEQNSEAFVLAGRTQGKTFATAFQNQVAALLGQAQAIQQARTRGVGGDLLGAGARPEIVEPIRVLNLQLDEQKKIRQELTRTRLQIAKAVSERDAKAVAAAQKKKQKGAGRNERIDLTPLMVGSTS